MPGEKPCLHFLLPGGVLASRAVAVSLRPAGRLSLVPVGLPVPLAGSRKSGNPAPLFRQNLQGPVSFPRPPLLAKTRAGLALGCGSLAGGLLFLRVPGFLCVRPPGAPYAAGSGIALPAKKIKAGRRLVRFFSPARGLTKFKQSVIIWLWLIPTNRQISYIIGNTIGIKRGVRNLAYYKPVRRSSRGNQTRGLFFLSVCGYRVRVPEYRNHRRSLSTLMQ